MSKVNIIIPRELLLVEIERRCRVPECNARARIGLTKDEARAYTGFECEICNQWNADGLNERDVPEWWEELAVTDMYALRNPREDAPNESGDVVTRMSENYHHSKTEEKGK